MPNESGPAIHAFLALDRAAYHRRAMAEPAVSAFIGRQRELARLRMAFEQATSRRSTTALVAGEAGVGKSRLLRAFADHLEGAGARILLGNCLELGERGIPYAPFLQALRTLIRSIEPARALSLLGPARVELGRLLPEVALHPGSTPSVEEGMSLAQPRLFELLLGLFERLSRDAPLVLMVEDIHWADEATRDLLAFLVRVLREPGVLFLVTARRDEIAAGHPLRSYLAELERLEQVETIDVATFERAEVAAQIRSLTGGRATEEQVDAIAARTNGNPFFIEQVVVAHTEQLGRNLPSRLADVLRARLEQLSPATQDVLRAAAAGGTVIDDELLAEVADLPPRAVHAALREAIGRQVLVPVVGSDATGDTSSGTRS